MRYYYIWTNATKDNQNRISYQEERTRLEAYITHEVLHGR